MGMTLDVVGFRAPDDQWRRMKAVYDSCRSANVLVPDEVEEFFGHEPPDETGIEVELTGLRQWKDETREGYELIIATIPKSVTILRFFAAW